MKIILKVSMICGLLLSVFGTVQAARKYSPGEAMRMATTGNFNTSESEQILADIPEDWKKEHRGIVRQMMNRARRDAQKITKPKKEDVPEVETDDFTTDDLEFKEDISEFQGKNLGMKEFQRTEENFKKNEANDLRLAELMKGNLNHFIDKRYSNYKDEIKENTSLENDIIAKMAINPKHFNNDYASLIKVFNNFLIALNSDKDFQDICITFLGALGDLDKNNEEVKKECLAIVQTLNTWRIKYLKAVKNIENTELTKKLNESIKLFGGEVTEEGKESTERLISYMQNGLSALIKARYRLNNGWMKKSFESVVNMGSRSKDYEIDTNLVTEDRVKIVELFNKIINNIYKDNSNDSEVVGELIKGTAEDCVSFVEMLKEIRGNINNLTQKPNQSIGSHIKQILSQLEDWNNLRVKFYSSSIGKDLEVAIREAKGDK